MRYLALLVTLSFAISAYGRVQVNHLVAPGPGSTLPVVLVKTMKPAHLTVGQPITAQLMQRVLVSINSYLPAKVKVIGHVVGCGPSSFSMLFTQLRWKGETVPIHLRLVAAASSFDVFQSGMPVAETDRSTSDPADWTTRQIGGDLIYRSAGSGKVYDQYSQPVGYATLHGVYTASWPGGGPPRAMGPFSTTATGLHGLPGFSIASAGDAGTPITFAINRPHWQIASGTALLLEVVD